MLTVGVLPFSPVSPKQVSTRVQLRRITRAAAALSALTSFGIGLNASAAAPASGLDRAQKSSLERAWIAADFDGNLVADFITASLTPSQVADPLTGDGQRYRLSVHLDQPPDSSAAPFSGFSAPQLLARDVDGDTHIDLVLQSLTSELLAVWINDGRGHFTEAAIERYQRPADLPESPRWSNTRGATTREENFEDFGPSVMACEGAAVAPALFPARLVSARDANWIPTPQETPQARGPPAHF